MKIQTKEQMLNAGADEQEAAEAMNLFELLRPGLKIKRNGRIETREGDKYPLGLYRTIKRNI